MQIRRNPLFQAQQSASRLSSIVKRMERAELVAITGVEVHKPSDAPGGWSKLHGLASDLADQETWLDAAGGARDLLDTAESTLGSAENVVKQAWERAIQLSSESYGTDERTGAASEIRQLREELLSLSNTSVAGRHLFAGDDYGGAAFDAAGTYTGTGAGSEVVIGDGQSVGVTLDGSEVFQGNVDIFAVLSNLETALAADDAAGVGATLDDLETASRQLISARQDVGYRRARTDDAVEVASNLSLLLDERLTEAVAADPAKAFTELAQLQNSYTAALQVTASSSGSKLFDFLR